jgi:hypothetical protein
MNLETIKDEELRDLQQKIGLELTAREERRKQEAIDKIKQIAAGAKLYVSFAPGKNGNGKSTLKAGDRYMNPADATKAYVVGKGRPPEWFNELQRKGRLPLPVPPLE